MKVGDRVRLSAEGRRHCSNEWGLYHSPDRRPVDFLLPPDVRGTVVRPGRSRGGLRLMVLVDGGRRPKSYHAGCWEEDR